MSYTFSLALVEEYSAGRFLDTELSAPLKSTPTPDLYLSPGKTMDHSRLSRYGMTFVLLTERLGAALLMWCVEGSRAKTSAPPGKVPGSAASEAGFGEKWPASLAKYDHATRSWRTHQFSLLGGLDEFSETWPKWGLMHDGECWALATLEHATDGTEFGFVPTVLTSEATGPGLHGNGSHNFRTWFRENSTERRLPLHGEIMMLWPEGWASAGVPLATDKFRLWQRLHGGF